MTYPFNNSPFYQKWSLRLARNIDKLKILRADFDCAMQWHFLGGKRYFVRYAREIISSHKWVFIVGCNNSGTSILQTLLGASGEVSTLPFEGQMYTTVFPRARKRNYERVWSEYLDELVQVRYREDLAGPRIAHDWMRCLEVPIQRYILEKTTANAIRMQWLQGQFPDSYFIGLVRNGYAVAEGIRRKGNKTIERGARHWNTVNKAMLVESAKLKNFMELRYEDLVNDPKKSVSNLAQFLDMDVDVLFENIKNNKKNSSRLTLDNYVTTLTNMNYRSFDKLGPEDIKTIEQEAGEMLTYFGYDKPSKLA